MFVAWLETQNGLVAENDIPHGFFKFASVTGAKPGTLETKFVCVNASGRASRVMRKKAENKSRECFDKRLREDMAVNLR